MLPWIQWGILFPWSFCLPCYTSCLFGTRLGSLLSISVVLPVSSGCYPGYSSRFYFLGVSSSLVSLHVFVWYKTWIITQYISGLTCQQWMLPWIQKGNSISLEFLLTLITFMSLFGTRLGSLLSISVVLPVNSGCYPGYSGGFYFLGVSSNLDNIHVFVWYKTWIFTQYISGLTCQQWMLLWIQWGILFPWSFF